MKYQPLNDLIDPDVPVAETPAQPAQPAAPRAPETRGIKYQTLIDELDPDVPAADAPVQEAEADPDAPEDAYVIGAPGKMILTLKSDAKMNEDRPRTWVKPVAILSAALFVGLTVWNLSKLMQGPPVPPPPSPFHLKQALYMAAIKVEAYRREHGVTPASLADTGLASPPYSYTRVDPNVYVVAVDLHGSKLEYDSTVALDKYFGTPKEMLTTENHQ
ncbi:MAG TPA: hypothetical protein VFV19_10850 [Candidatus Polarisedimenticolaceae bacterium]|nr:hypothetical protein [Candidatus Polarisedimenticolaceae bacterium]